MRTLLALFWTGVIVGGATLWVHLSHLAAVAYGPFWGMTVIVLPLVGIPCFLALRFKE